MAPMMAAAPSISTRMGVISQRVPKARQVMSVPKTMQRTTNRPMSLFMSAMLSAPELRPYCGPILSAVSVPRRTSPSSLDRLDNICRHTVVITIRTAVQTSTFQSATASRIPSSTPAIESGSVRRRMDWIAALNFITQS